MKYTSTHLLKPHVGCLLLMLFSANARAADLMVAVGGSGNVHPTISSAITAAAIGDRILIAPGAYTENLNINKALELNCNVNGQRFTVVGNLVISATGTNVLISVNSMVLQGTVTEFNGPSTGAGSKVTFTGCTTGSVTITIGLAATMLYRDTINGAAFLARGSIIGSVITGEPAGNGVQFLYSTPTGITNRVIGNVIGSAMGNSAFWPILVPAASPFVCENNLLVLNMTSSNAFPILVPDYPSPTATLCTIRNNTFIHPNLNGIYFIKVDETDPNFHVDIRNNFFVGPLVNPPINVSGNPSAVVAYNIETANAGHVVPGTGLPTAGSPAIDAGDPDVVFSDLDLSRNDLGCYGGGFSRDNFDDPLPTSAFVAFVNAPRRTQAALTIPITADGIDR